MACNNTKGVVEVMAKTIANAKNIYKRNVIEEMEIEISEEHGKYYVTVECIRPDDEHWRCWGIESLDSKEEAEIAKKLLRLIDFKHEYPKYLENKIHVDIRNSPKLKRTREAIRELKDGNFYDELHHEDDGYALITKHKKGLKEFQEKNSDIVRVYQESKDLFYVYIG